MEHENTIGESDEWYTPRWIFDKLDVLFDVDVCSPGSDHWVPADSVITKEQGCIETDWGENSFVFMNPPFEGRNGHVKYLEKFLSHKGGGIAICRAYTSAEWFHDHAVRADGLFFPKGKTKFVRPDGSVGNSPGAGVVFLCSGRRACEIMQRQDWGWYVSNHKD